MTSRILAAAVAAATIGSGLAMSGETPSEAKATPAKPNVVVIQADDQSLEMMRAMERTNRLIGEHGATYRSNFTNWPVCCPSRATQLTGQYAHNHGVLGNSPPLGGYGQFPRDDNLAVWLNEAGYRVGHVGKFLNGYGDGSDDPETPYDDVLEVPPGWTEWRTGSGGSTYRFYDFVQNVWDDPGDPNDPREGVLVPYAGEVDDHKNDVNTGEAVELVNEYSADGDPFYLQVDYLAPHGGGPREDFPQPPIDCGRSAKPAPRHATAFDGVPLATQADDDSFNEADVTDKPPSIQALPVLDADAIDAARRRYECRMESTLSIDEGVADLIGALRESGELQNTYVFYTSDNGFFHGEHRVPSGKMRVYEPSIHVPLLMRGPDVPAGVQVRDLTTNADFATTVMALTGAASTAGRIPDGRSLVGAANQPWRETGRELLIETNNYAAIRTQRYKWVEYTGGADDGAVELYDLREDPFELSNVAGDEAYAEIAQILAGRLAALRVCVGASCRVRPDLDAEMKRLGSGGDRPCVRISVTGGDVPATSLVLAYVDGDLVGTDDVAPYRIDLRKGQVGDGRMANIRTVAELVDGRRVNWQRRVRTCR